MSLLADLRKPFSLQYWLGLPRERVRFARRFIGIAITLAAAKVFLNTIAFALFLANEGASQLPRFYLLLALTAIVLSIALGIVVDRMPKLRLARATFVMIMLAAGAGKLMIAGGVAGAYFIILAIAFIFEIAIEILFWAACAAYVDTTELKRATPLICLAIALGGAFGGLFARALSWTVDAPDLLLIMLMFAGLATLQFAVPADFGELPDGQSERATTAELPPRPWSFLRVAVRHPLLVLIALNALALTILYGIAEFLILSVYSEHYPQEQELARFLGIVFALLQACEFVLLASLSRMLLERTDPLVRNLVFPLTSLICFICLALSDRLSIAVIAHVNAEAASNAIFQPIHNANFLALPLRIQGRARTLSEGIFYPTGLAIAGALLWSLDTTATTAAAEFIAVLFTLVFILINIGIGVLFLPTLLANVGSGVIRRGQTIAAAPSAPRVRALLQSREPELRLLGLTLAQRLDPAALEDDLRALARRSERATRTALARLVTAAPGPWAQHFLDGCLTGETEDQLKLALLVMLIRRAPLKPEHMPRMLNAHDPAVTVLAHVVAEGPGAWPHIQPLLRSSEVASDLVDAILAAERTDCTPLLLACLGTAEPEQQRRALVMLNGSAEPPCDAMAEVLRLLASRRNAAVRAEAIVLLSRRMARPAAVRELVAALDDPSPRVRRGAAQALCQHGDRATALLRHRLGTVTVASLDVVWALAWIASPRARRLLAAHVRKLQQDAERTARLRDRIAASPDRARWAVLELCLHDHRVRMVEVILAALSPAIDARLMVRLRYALQGADQRYRASAFELVAAGPASRLIPGAVALLRYLLFEHGAGAGRLADAGAEIPLDQAMASMSPWVRRATALLTARSLQAPRVMSRAHDARPAHHEGPACGAGSAHHSPGGDRAMGLDDQEFERVLALKRTPLFRHVPFETLMEVARSVQTRLCLAGERVITHGTGGQDLLILEAGVLTIGDGDGATTLTAPACFGEVAVAGEPISWPNITAVEDSRVSLLRATIFQELCGEHPEMALELCRLLARRLREAGAADAH